MRLPSSVAPRDATSPPIVRPSCTTVAVTETMLWPLVRGETGGEEGGDGDGGGDGGGGAGGGEGDGGGGDGGGGDGGGGDGGGGDGVGGDGGGGEGGGDNGGGGDGGGGDGGGEEGGDGDGGGGEGSGEGGGGKGVGEGGGGGGRKKRRPQSVQSVPKSHCTGAPNKAVSDPGPPSWHAALLACVHESSHAIGGGGEGGGGEGGGGVGGGEGGGGRKKRRPQSVQSVPKSHCAGAPNKAESDPGPPSWHAALLACVHESSHAIGGGGEGGGEGGGGDGGCI